MASLSNLSEANQIAYLAGLFNWNVENGSYTNPDGQTVSFHVVDANTIPVEQYIQGELNTFSLVNSLTGSATATDPNKNLFNTQLTANGLSEIIQRKYAVYRPPFCNYDVPADLGLGGQLITFTIIFAGTMWLTAMMNFIQNIFNNDVSGLGTLQHPFYPKIKNVLPISCKTDYNYQSLNFVLSTVVFRTSDISHLNPSSLKTNIVNEISKWYIGTQNAITSMAGTITALNSTINQFNGTLQ